MVYNYMYTILCSVCSVLLHVVLPYSSNTGDNGEMKALQQELRGLRELLEQQQQQQQQKPPFDLSTLQHPFWQHPGPFPFSNSMQNSNPVPPTHGGLDEHTTAPDNAARSDSEKRRTPSERKHPVEQSHPLTSKVDMDHSTQQEHVQYPEHVLANGRKDGASNKPSKTTKKIIPQKKQRHHHSNMQYSSTSQTDQSDSSISSLTSSSSPSNKSPVPSNRSPVLNKSLVSDDKSSVLSELGSSRLSPLRASSPRGVSPVTTETIRVPSNANLSTWVCPLCGGRSIIIDNSGTRQHQHQQPDEIKTKSRSTQYIATSHRHGNRNKRNKGASTRNKSASTDPISGGLYSGLYSPNNGLHHDSDSPSVRSDHGYDPNNKSSGLHYNTDVPGIRSRSLYYDDNIPTVRSSSLHRDTAPNIRTSGLDHSTPGIKSRRLHYDDDIPNVRSSGLHYNATTPHIRSSSLHFDTNTPHLRSSGLHYDPNTLHTRNTGLHHGKRTKPYKRSRRKYQHKPSHSASVTFSHPKATSTPAYLYTTTTHGYTSDSSDVSSSVVGRNDHVVLESTAPLPRYMTHHRVTSPGRRRRYYGSRYTVTSSDDEIVYQPVTR